MKIINLTLDNQPAVEQAAKIIVAAFAEHWANAWQTVEDGLEEVHDILNEDESICRVALDDDGTVLGWIGGLQQYDGHVYELHPLAVDPAHQGKGIGRVLVQDFERIVREKGASTIILGSDDEDNMTSLSQVDLYVNTWEHIANIQNFKRHPYEFYQKLGYHITGVIPDANGPGKPDILMAKRL